jgi:hypothetical protein
VKKLAAAAVVPLLGRRDGDAEAVTACARSVVLAANAAAGVMDAIHSFQAARPQTVISAADAAAGVIDEIHSIQASILRTADSAS